MSYENIRLRKQNFTMVDGYFYMIDEDTDSLIVKTDDGTQAYSYPLDTTIASPILSFEHDGRNFWSLEDSGSDAIIRRWYLDNYVCKQRNSFTITGVSSNAFTVEHYHSTFGADEDVGQTTLSISSTAGMIAGDTIFLGPNSSGESEEREINNIIDSSSLVVTVAIDYAYSSGDPVSTYHRLWVFDDTAGGKLHEYDPYTPTTVSSTSGGEYYSVAAATFYDMYDATYRSSWSEAICYVKTTNMLFTNPNDLTNFGSLSMDNVEDDQATVIPLYDLTIEGTNIYRLQRKATYYGTTYTFADSTYNYQLSTSTPFITSISLAAEPAILPANGVNSSTITAIVKDQFSAPISAKSVAFTEDDPNGFITTTPVNTNAYGVAQTAYKAGTTAREVKVTATAQQS